MGGVCRGRLWVVVAVTLVAGLVPAVALSAVDPSRAEALAGDLVVPAGNQVGAWTDSPTGAWMVAGGYGPDWGSKLALLDTSSGVFSELTLPATPSGGVRAVVDDSGSVVVAVFRTSGSALKAWRWSGGSWSSGVDLGIGSPGVSGVDATASGVYVLGANGWLASSSWAASSWGTHNLGSSVVGEFSVVGSTGFVARYVSGSPFATTTVTRVDLSSWAVSTDPGLEKTYSGQAVMAGPDGVPVTAYESEGTLSVWRWTGSVWERRVVLLAAELTGVGGSIALGSDGRLHLVGRQTDGTATSIVTASVDIETLSEWSEISSVATDMSGAAAVSSPSAGPSRPVGVVTDLYATSGGSHTHRWVGAPTALAAPTRTWPSTRGSDHKIASVQQPPNTGVQLRPVLSGNGEHAGVAFQDGTWKVVATDDPTGERWEVIRGVPADPGLQGVGVNDDGSFDAIGPPLGYLWDVAPHWHLDRGPNRWVGGRRMAGPDLTEVRGARLLSAGEATVAVFDEGWVDRRTGDIGFNGAEFTGVAGPSALAGDRVITTAGSTVRIVPSDLSAETLVSSSPGVDGDQSAVWSAGGSVWIVGRSGSGSSVVLKRSDDLGATWTVVDPGSAPGWPSGSSGPVAFGFRGTTKVYAFRSKQSGSESIIYRSERGLAGSDAWSTPVEIGRIPAGEVALAVATGPTGPGHTATEPDVYAAVLDTSTGTGGLYHFGDPLNPGGVPGLGDISELFGPNGALRNPDICACNVGDPVDVRTGNQHFPLPAVAVPGRGPGLSVELGYNTFNASRDSAAGYGWSTTLDMRIDTISPTRKTVVQETGATVPFELVGGVWKAPERFIADLVPSGGGFVFTRRHGQSFRFDSAGRLAEQSDLFGNSTTVHYPSSTSAEADYLEDEGGRRLSLTWIDGRVNTITDELDSGDGGPRVVDFDYDASGNLKSYRDQSGGVWTFTWDSVHRMKTVRKPVNQGVAGAVVENHYDAQGRVDWQDDELDRRTSIAYGSPTVDDVTVTLPGGRKRLTRFDGGLRTETVEGWDPADPAAGVSAKVHFDPVTRALESTEDDGGNVTTFTDADEDGNVDAVEDPTGRITRFTYDAFDQVVETRTGEVRTGPTTTSTADVVVNRNDYDATNGRLEKVTAAVGTADEAITDLQYTDSAHPDDLTRVVDGRSKVWKFGYDPGTGDQTWAEDPLGNKSVTTYNSVGWPKTVTSPQGVATTAVADDFQTAIAYDTAARSTTVTGPAKAGDPRDVSRTVLDASGNTESVATGITAAKPDGDVTRYDYTPAGEVWKVTAPGGAFKEYHYRSDGLRDWYRNELGAQTDYGYDAAGRPDSSTDPNAKVTRYGYDAAGRLATVTQPGAGATCTGTKVHCVTYSYDDAGRPTGIDYSDAGTPDVTAISYDALGRRTAATAAGVTETWAWNKRSQLTGHSDANGDTTGYQWDAGGNLTHITYPGTAGTVVRGFDDAGRMTSVTDLASRTVSFGYDADSNWTNSTFPGTSGTANTDTYGYDAAGRMTAATWKQGATVLGSETYTRPRSTKGMVADTTMAGAAGSGTKTNGYDTRDRLTAAGSESFSIDDAGNLTKGPTGQRQVFDPAQQLCWTSPTATSGTCATPASDATTYTYDDRGNRTSMTAPGAETASYRYDQADRLVAATPNEEGQLVTYASTRLADTRSASATGVCDGGTCTRLSANTAVEIAIAGHGPVPSADVAAIWATVTVANPAANGVLKVNPTSGSAAVTLNYTSGVDRNTTAIVPVIDGKITVVADTAADVIIDSSGYFEESSTTGDTYRTASPQRIVDTRNGTGTCNGTACSAPTTPNTPMLITMAGTGGMPSTGLRDAVIALTVVSPAAGGQLTVAPGTGGAGAATISYTAGHTINEVVIAPVDSSGRITITSTTSVNVVIDSSGYFLTPAAGSTGLALHNLTPTRLVDSSTGTGPCVGAACSTLVGSTRQTVTVRSNAGVPASATAVVGFLTVNSPSNDGFVRLNPTFSTGVGLGGDETINYVTGTKRNAAVLVPIKTDGTIQIVSSSNAGHWTLDISGYLTQTAGTTTYRYDAGGTRAAKLNPDRTTTTFTYSAGSGLPLLLRQRTGTASTYLVYGPGGQPIEQINPDGTATWLHHDQLGSVRLATKTSDGTTRTTRRFNAYGTVANQTTTGGDKQPLLGYAGQYTDPETGFQYLRARYYDPASGAFITIDPIVAMTQQSYSYVGGNPVNGTDPSGLCGPFGSGACPGGSLVPDGISDPIGSVVEGIQDKATDPHFWVDAATALGVGLATSACIAGTAGVGTALCIGGAVAVGTAVGGGGHLGVNALTPGSSNDYGVYQAFGHGFVSGSFAALCVYSLGASCLKGAAGFGPAGSGGSIPFAVMMIFGIESKKMIDLMQDMIDGC